MADARRAKPGSSRRSRGPNAVTKTARPRPLDAAEIAELEALLDAVAPPLEPLDIGTLDGFLCGVLVQPQPIAASRWLARVTDIDGRALPKTFDATRLHELVLRRHAELASAIAARTWFDPWVFADDDDAGETDAVYPWVAGFAAALELFPAPLHLSPATTREPLAVLYRHLDPEDLEDADELLAEIEASDPPADLSEAVEDLVRATLLLADAAATGRG